jgi:hypothetical protein
MSLDAIQGTLGDERGGVLVIFLLFAPVAVLMAVFVIDVGNWFEHKRHLQLQADAGALAAAQEFRFPCSDDPIVAAAQKYSGMGAAALNVQIGKTTQANVHELIDSKTYFNQASPVDSTVRTGPPCGASMVDVKLTETDLPWFFKLMGVPFINAHARVEIRQKDSGTGGLPIAVNDTQPRAAAAYFVDESNGTVLASTPLTRTGSSGGLGMWSSAAPVPVTVDKPNIAVRIALSGSTTDTTCGHPLVSCYEPSATSGLLHIRGWSGLGTGSASAPIARDVTLSAGSCADAYFSPSGCTVGVQAKIDFGADPATLGPAQVHAVVNGNSYALTYSSSTGLWSSTSANYASLPASAGSIPVDLAYKDNTTKNKFVTFATAAQRSYTAASASSGPIKLAVASENGAGDANSFRRCETGYTTCSHNLGVTIGISGNLQDAQGVGDPVVALRVTGGSQNQSLDCDPNLNKLKDELAQGCHPTYTKNTGTACPGGTGSLWATPQPWPCVGLQTGSAINDVPAGLNQRILGNDKASSCTSPNHWASFPNLPKGDPRIVNVFLTPFGTFQGSGNDTVAVIGFATFYVTGWAGQGNGFDNPCQGNGDDTAQPGYIVGHFIKYIDTIDTGGGGSSPCDLSVFGTCVAILTE